MRLSPLFVGFVGPVAMVLSCALLPACGGTTPTGAHLTSPRQAAGIIAKHEDKLLSILSIDENCRTYDCFTVVGRLGRYRSFAAEAGAMEDDLKDAGPFDHEVARLADRTISAGQRVIDTWHDLDRCTQRFAGQDYSNCSSEDRANEQARVALKPILAEWKPYGA